MAIVNYKTDYPLCILINNKEINKDYLLIKILQFPKCYI